jgi:hypothetical protein
LHREPIVVSFSNLPLLITDPPLVGLLSLPYDSKGALHSLQRTPKLGPDGPQPMNTAVKLKQASSLLSMTVHWVI